MSINRVYKPVDPSLVLYIDGQGSRRLENKVTNLGVNPDQRLFPVLDFDGIDDYVLLGTSQIIDISHDFTVFFWYNKQDKTLDNDRFISLLYNADNNFQLIVDSSSQQYAVLLTRDGVPVLNGVLYGLHVQNKPTFVLFTISGSNAYFYINNIQRTPAGSTTVGTGSTYKNTIGIRGDLFTSTGVKGQLSKTGFYSRAVTSDERLSLFQGNITDTTGLVMYYPGNGFGSTLIDYSGNNNHGTIYGATWADGKANGTLVGGISYKNSPTGKSVLNFDGSTGYIKHPITNNYSSNMSCFVWAKAPFESYIIGRYDTGLSSRSWLLGTDQANEKRMRVLLSSNGAYGSTTSKDYLTTAEVFDNSWHLYGFSWDSGTLKLYVDGREQTVTKTYDAAFSSIYNSSSDIIVGARIISNVPSGFYTGQVGEYYIYKRTVSQSEGSILYNDTRKFYGR